MPLRPGPGWADVASAVGGAALAWWVRTCAFHTARLASLAHIMPSPTKRLYWCSTLLPLLLSHVLRRPPPPTRPPWVRPWSRCCAWPVRTLGASRRTPGQVRSMAVQKCAQCDMPCCALGVLP